MGLPPLTWEQNVDLILTRLFPRGMKPLIKMIMTFASPSYHHRRYIDILVKGVLSGRDLHACDICTKPFTSNCNLRRKHNRFIRTGRRWHCHLQRWRKSGEYYDMRWDELICNKCVWSEMFVLAHPFYEDVKLMLPSVREGIMGEMRDG